MLGSTFFVLAVLFAASPAVPVATGYANPVLPGFHPDPSVCRVGKDYYLANSSFSYAPGIPIFHSRDLVSWKQIAYAVTGESNLPLAHADLSAGLWAPTLRFHKGLFYLVTTNKSKGGNFLVTARRPEGPWSKPLWFDKDGWDPSLFFDDDGKVYLSRNGETKDGGFGILQYQLDVATGKKLSEEKIIWKGSGGFGAEGPHMYKINGSYLLLAAEGGTHAGHMITVARSQFPWGPFEGNPSNPILSQRDHLLERVSATGHGDLVQAHDNSWWIVFLGIRNFGSPMHMMHTLGRETFLAPVAWHDGWPVVNDGMPIKEAMVAKSLEKQPWPKAPVRTAFNTKALSWEWNTLRNSAEPVWSLSANKGSLTLCGQSDDLGTARGEPAFVGRRQEHHYARVATNISFSPTLATDEAGLTVFMSERFHYDLAVGLKDGKRRAFVRRTVEDLELETASVDLPEGDVTLEIESNPWAYFFYLRTKTGRQSLGKARSKLLSTEVAGGFTGMYFGMYATGRGTKSTQCAKFPWFDYEADFGHTQ
jgi:xylan 1,4-beta-xylosidase